MGGGGAVVSQDRQELQVSLLCSTAIREVVLCRCDSHPYSTIHLLLASSPECIRLYVISHSRFMMPASSCWAAHDAAMQR